MACRTAIIPPILIMAGILAALLIAGCSEQQFNLAPVRGTVTVDGRPVTGAKVMFAPIAASAGLEAGRPAFGTLQSDGSFVLTTYADDDGAVVGDHWATIIRTEPLQDVVNGTPPAASAAGSTATGLKFSRVTVPNKITVVAGQQNEVKIALTAQDVARFSQADD